MQVQQTKVQPSPKQVEMILDAIDMWKGSDATLLFEMDEDDSTVVLHLTEDGVTSHARFGITGCMIGDWVW